MTGTTQGAQTGRRDQLVFALILILVGIGGLILQATEGQADVGGVIVLLIGLGLLGAFAFTRQYGYLIPGGILTGLGVGIALQDAVTMSDDSSGGVIVLGLGLGFISIWLIGALVGVAQHHWWPLVPGGLLAVIGGALLVGGDAVRVIDYWGLVLVGIGLLVLWRAFTRRSSA